MRVREWDKPSSLEGAVSLSHAHFRDRHGSREPSGQNDHFRDGARGNARLATVTLSASWISRTSAAAILSVPFVVVTV